MRKTFIRLGAALALLAFVSTLFLGCNDNNGGKSANVPDLEATVAEVGGRTVTLGRLEQEVARYRTLFKITDEKGGEQGARLRKAILTRLIDDIVLEIEADRLGIIVSDIDLEGEVNSLLGKYDNARLGLILTENEISFDQWKKLLARRIKTHRLTVKEVDSRVIVTQKEIKEYFKKNADDFKWPMRVRALQIMVGDETVAEKIRKRLLNRAKFATIAKETSQSPDAADGGDLGFVSRGQLPPEFEGVVFNLKEGEVSRVIKSIYGFHIFKVVKIKKPRAMTYKEAKGRIQTLIFDGKREEVFKNWAKKIKKSVKIKVYSKLLSSPLP